MPAESHASPPSGAPSILLRAGAAAGLFEGIAVAFDAVAAGGAGALAAIATGAAFAATQVAVFAALARLLRALPPARALRIAVGLWALAVLAGRGLYGEALGPGVVWPALVGLVALHGVPVRRLRDGDLVGEGVALAAVAAIGVSSLRGLLRAPLPEALVLGGAAALALPLAASVRRWPFALPGALAAALLAALLAPLLRAPPPAAGPNVLWILVDTLRRDHVEPYGGAVSAPALARLAAGGARFDDAVTAIPKTPASVASQLTGLLPVHHGVRTLYDPLPAAPATAAELFASAGWRTAALVQNGWLSAERGFGRGFARFAGHPDLNAAYGLFDRFAWVRLLDRLGPRRIPRFDPETDAAVITRAASKRIAARSDGAPFFLYVHYFEPHWPYHPPADHARRHDAPPDSVVNHVPTGGVSRGRMIFQNPLPEAENEAARRLYRAEVAHTLESVGVLLDALDRHGLADDTIVVFTADHGHSLGEHGYHFHHGAFLYEPELRIPLLLRWPGRIAPGTVVAAPVRSIDLLPTLLELCGLAIPPDLDGRSLGPLLRGEPDEARPAYLESDVKMFAENTRREVDGVPGVIRGLRTGRFKLLLHATRGGPRFELYDLARDPAELRDVSGEAAYREDFAALRRELLAHLEPAARAALEAAPPQAGPAPVDREARERLRALGYLE